MRDKGGEKTGVEKTGAKKTEKKVMGNETSAPAPSAVGGEKKKRNATRPEYVLRVAVVGEKKVGKSSLIEMLTGQDKKSGEKRGEEEKKNQSVIFDWCFKSTNESVQFELFECGREGKEKKKSNSLKLTTEPEVPEAPEAPEIDSETAKIIRESDAVFFIYDPSRRESFDFCVAFFDMVAPESYVLFLENFRDLYDKNFKNSNFVGSAEARQKISNFSKSFFARHLQCSCRDKFGFSQIFSFLNLPFLRAQKKNLEHLMSRNFDDTNLAVEELDLICFELDYSAHLKWVTAERGFSKTSTPTFFSPEKKMTAAMTEKKSPIIVAAPPPEKKMGEKKKEEVDEENLDFFLAGAEISGWGETIDSDDSGEEEKKEKKTSAVTAPQMTEKNVRAEVIVPKMTEVRAEVILPEKTEKKSEAEVFLEEEEEKNVLKIESPNDGWGETMSSSESEGEEKKKETEKKEEEKKIVSEEEKRKKIAAEQVLAAALEEAKKMAEVKAEAGAEVLKKKKAGGKKKTAGKKKTSAPPAPSKRGDYDAL